MSYFTRICVFHVLLPDQKVKIISSSSALKRVRSGRTRLTRVEADQIHSDHGSDQIHHESDRLNFSGHGSGRIQSQTIYSFDEEFVYAADGTNIQFNINRVVSYLRVARNAKFNSVLKKLKCVIQEREAGQTDFILKHCPNLLKFPI